MENKKTKKELFGEVLKVVTSVEHKEFIQHELELLNKKAGNKKPTKVQEENEKIKVQILEMQAVIDKAK